MKRPLVLAALIASAATLDAAVVVVDPSGAGDHTDLQAGIDAASSGDVVRVVGGTYVGTIVIDKPLTVIGDPRPTILAEPYTFTNNVQGPTIDLAGPGFGEVVLTNIGTAGAASGALWNFTTGGVRIAGFDEVEIHRSEILAPQWIELTGVGTGKPAILGSVPLLIVTSSVVTAQDSDSDSCYGFAQAVPDGPAGIDVSGTVVLLDSTVTGGRGCWACSITPPTGLPCPCPGIGGVGGPGVVADVLFQRAMVSGGEGGDVVYYNGASGYVPWGQQPDGPPFVVGQLVDLADDLASTGPLKIGGSFGVQWTTTGLGNLLVVGFESGPPVDVPGHGWFFLDPSVPFGLFPLPDGLSSLTFAVPALPSLIGAEALLQIDDPTTGLTRPVVEPFLP